MYLYKKIIAFSFLFAAISASAQKGSVINSAALQGKDFKALDEYVKKLGTLDNKNMGEISLLLTKNYTDKTDKVRAIYDWITNNISYDIKTARNGGTEKNSSAEVLLSRKATGAGYANLFQDMCSSASIRCLTAEGFIKFGIDDINAKKTSINHSWDVVQLGQSPDAWYYVDACMGSGYPDAEFKTFTKAFNPDYFFANLFIFNLQHFPDNIAWQLGPGPKTKKDFYAFPVIKSAAYEFGLKKLTPVEGAVKVKAGKPLSFAYLINGNVTVNKISLFIESGKKKATKDLPFTFNNNILECNYKFPEEDSYTVTVLLNDKALAQYAIEVN